MVEYYFYPMSDANMASYPYVIKSSSVYAYSATGPQGPGFYSSMKHFKKVNDALPFYRSNGNLLEVGYNSIVTTDYTGLYIEKSRIDENDIINKLFGYTKVVLEFFETEKTVSGLGYVYRHGWNGKCYYLDKPGGPQERAQLKDVHMSPSLSELGYKHGSFWGDKQGYYRVKPQHPTTEDIVKLLFVSPSLLPAYFASEKRFHKIPGYTFKSHNYKLGYHRDVQDCTNDIDIIHSWFKEIEKCAEASNTAQRTITEKDHEIQKLSVSLNDKEKELAAIAKEKETAFTASKKTVSTLQQELEAAKGTIKEKETAFSASKQVVITLQQELEEVKGEITKKDEMIQELEAVINSLVNEQPTTSKSTCDLCDALRQQLQEKDKQISWLLTQVTQQSMIRREEVNLIDL